jgi:hypothetical protein
MSSPQSSLGESPPRYPENGKPRHRANHPEVWNSFGFVEVGEQRGEDGDLFGYPMKRTKSSLFVEHSDENISANYRLLENRISLLQRELVTIKRKVDVFEEDSSKTSKWGVKYSRM